MPILRPVPLNPIMEENSQQSESAFSQGPAPLNPIMEELSQRSDSAFSQSGGSYHEG